MKVGIYSPYLDSASGGERYMLTIAEILSKENSVDVFLDSHLSEIGKERIVSINAALLGLDLSKVSFIKAPFGEGAGIWERSKFLKSYDLVFYLTDGSLFYSTAKKNILHIQSPIKTNNSSVWKKIKKSTWDLIIYNSEFTKSYCEKFWGLKGEVVYPPVDISSFRSSKKKKQILSVGRFNPVKKHEVMIKAFKKIFEKKNDWEFYLTGGVMKGDNEYVDKLKDLAKGYPIYILPGVKFDHLKELYSQSSIYWHAAGFGETDPTKMEHFGITTVEAMASGCVPVVINLGGQKEIVDEGKNGMLWDFPEQMESKTLELINNKNFLEKLAESAIKRSQQFSKEKFVEKIKQLIA